MNQLEAKQAEILLSSLDGTRIGGEYLSAIKKHDFEAALYAAGVYFKNRPDMNLCRIPAVTEDICNEAIRAIKGDVTVVRVAHQFPEGKIDFLYDATIDNPPRNDEWLWQLNRMYFWTAMSAMYHAEKDERYAEAFQRQMRSWIASCACPSNWNGPGSAWRTIEAGLRLLGSWSLAFEVFRKSETVSPESIALMVSSMYSQAVHSMEHRTGHNWLIMEMTGVFTFAALFPEFTDSTGLRKKSLRILCRSIGQQLLPDGFHNELSPDYHSVITACGVNIYHIAECSGRLAELPEKFIADMEKAANAVLETMTPAFTLPCTNDCFILDASAGLRRFTGMFPARKDFLWGASAGKEGIPPQGKTASRYLPYAGFAVMRSGWNEDASYCCFDVGPLGAAHWHQDKLNINIWKGKTELVFDDGGGQYEYSDFRVYAVSGKDHNVAVVDDLPQYRKSPHIVKKPIDAKWVSSEMYDFACASYHDGYGDKSEKTASQKRSVLFLKPDAFIVSDLMRSCDGNPHKYALRFHTETVDIRFSPVYEGGIIADLKSEWDLLLLPLTDSVKTTIRTASTEPDIAGWYVGRNSKDRHPASTIVIEAEPCRRYHFITLIYPLKHGTDSIPSGIHNILESAVRNGTKLNLKKLQKRFPNP